jgi:hypothetical protein
MKKRAKQRAARNGKKAARNGKAPGLAELFARAAAAPPAGPAAPGDDARRAAVLAGVASGAIFTAGADELRRLGAAIASGELDDLTVPDEVRQKIVAGLGERLKNGSAGERTAAAAVLQEVLRRPGAKVSGPETAPSETAGDGAERSAKGGHDRAGRFQRGNKCSLGNPFARRMALFRSALLRDLDGPKLEALGAKLYSMALAGDVGAAELLLKYACGKPAPVVNPDTLDADEYAVLSAGPSLARLWLGVHEAVDPRLACSIWRKLSASSADAATTQLVNAIEAEPERFVRDLDRARARAAAAGR